MSHPHQHAVRSPARRCDCGAVVYADSFRDRGSYRESYVTEQCQACQDNLFLATDDGDHGPSQYALRRGAVAAFVERGGVPELGVLPFVFTVPSRPLAWEARYATRVVPPGASSLDPYTELEAMHDILRYHQVRLLTPDAFDHPLLAECFGRCELLIGLDTSSLDRIGALCPALADAAQAPFAVPFERAYGADLSSLGEVVASLRLDAPSPTPSALRLCGWMGALLTGPLPSVRPLFPEVLLPRPDVVAQCPPWRMETQPPPTWVSERPKWQGYVL